MIRNKLFIGFILLLCTSPAFAQQQYSLKTNLQHNWRVYDDNQYKKFSDFEEPVRTIYFSLPIATYRGDFLEITGKYPFSILIDNILWYDKTKQVRIAIDTLKEFKTRASVQITIHQDKNISPTDLSTNIITKNPGAVWRC